MKNKEVVESFINREIGHSLNLYSTGNKLFSYRTCIAQWYTSDILLLNTTYYSNSTSHHLGILKRSIPEYINIYTKNNIERDSDNIECYFNLN